MAQGRAPKIISEIKEYIQDLKRSYEETQHPITDDSVPLHKLCAKLEYMLQIDMKSRTGVFAGKKDYWDYIYQCLYKVKGLDDGIRFVKAMNEVKTSLGRGRAFIRYSLTHHRLGDSLQQCFTNQKVTSSWFNPSSLLLNPGLYGPLINDLYDLNDIQFDLAPSGHDLDAAWPTYSRRVMGPTPVMYNMWQPPERTESLSSLSSQPSTVDGYPQSPSIESRPGLGEERLMQVQAELEECEQVNRQLRNQIVQLERDNEDIHRLAMETEERMSNMQSELERKVQDLQYQLEKAAKEASDIKSEANDGEKEWRKKLQDAEKINSDLCDRLEAINLQHTSQEKVWQESEQSQQLKVIEAERLLAEIKVELSTARSELDVSRTMEAKKAENVVALETKVNALESKNAELLKKMEGMVDDKDAEVTNHLQSANKVHELLDKLSEAETRNLELRGERDTLNRRVELLEANRDSVDTEMMARVAELEQSLAQMESENRKMIESVKLKDEEHEVVVKNLNESVSSLESEKDNLEFTLTEHVRQLDSVRKTTEGAELNLAQSKKEVVSVQQKLTEMTRDMDRLRKELHAAGVQNEDLSSKVRHLEDVCHDRQTEIEDTERQLKEISSTHSDTDQQLHKEKDRTRDLEQQIQELNLQIRTLNSEKLALTQQVESVECLISNNEESGLVNEPLQKSSNDGDMVVQGGTPLQEQITRLLTEKKDLSKRLEDVQSDNKNLLTEIKILSAKSSVESKSISEKAELAERTQAEVDRLQQKLDSMGKTLESKEKSLQGQNLEMQRLEEQLKTAVATNEQLELDIARIRLAVDNKDKERDHLISEKTKLEDKLDAARKDTEDAQKHRDEFEKKIGEQNSVVAQLMTDVEHLKTEKHEVEDAKESIQKILEREWLTTRELEDTVEDLKRLQEESVSLEQVYDERKAKMVQEHADKVEFLTEQFSMMKEEQEKTSSERLHFQEQAETLAREADELRERCEILDSENVAIKDKNNDLNLEILRMQEVVALSKTERDEITEKLEQVSTETSHSLQERKMEIEKLQGKVSDVEKQEEERSTRLQELEKALEQEKKRAEEMEMKARSAEEEVTSIQCTMEEEISALKFQLSSEAMQYQHTLQGYQEQEVEMQQVKSKSDDQEQTINELRAEITTLKQKINQEKVNFQRKHSDQENEILRQERQIIIHQDSVEELSRCLEEEKRINANLQVEVIKLRNESGDRVAVLENEMALIQSDNEQLKKQIVKLVKEKDTLWQRTEKLEYHRKMKASERWLEDKQVTHCMQCEAEFSLTVRRHHCRLCGRIFCAKCANFFVLTSHSKKKSRVCEKCFVINQHSLEAASLNTSIISLNSSGEDIEDRSSVVDRFRLGSASVLSDAMSDNMSESMTSEPAGLDDVEGDQEEQGGVVDADTSGRKEEEEEALHARMEGEEDNGHSKEGSSKPNTPSPTTTSDKSTSEPDFDIIGEDEVTAAREDPDEKPEDTERTADDSSILTIAGLEGDGVSGVEIAVGAYQRHTLPVLIDEIGLMLCWEFVSSPKSIGFSVIFQESQEPESPSEELIPLCRCNSHQHAVQGELLARKVGIYSLIFDNKFSRFTSKTVKYSLNIKRPEAAY